MNRVRCCQRALWPRCLVLALLGYGLAGQTWAADEPNPTNEAQLVALGALSATSMISTQAFLGTAADGLAEGLYKDPQELVPDLEHLVATLEASIKAVQGVRMAKVSEADQAFLEGVAQVFALEQAQAVALKAYAASKDKADLKKWQTAREEAQKKMDALLGGEAEELVPYENVKEKLSPALQERFVSFRFRYPASWAAAPPPGKEGASTFVRLESTAEEGGKKFLLEQFAVNALLFPGEITREQEATLLRERSGQFAAALPQAFPEFKKVKEGPQKLGAYTGYGFDFTAHEDKKDEEAAEIFGRLVLLPPRVTGQKYGLAVALVATAHAEDINTLDDLGVKGELPLLIGTLELGPPATKAAPARPPQTP